MGFKTRSPTFWRWTLERSRFPVKGFSMVGPDTTNQQYAQPMTISYIMQLYLAKSSK